MIRFVPALAAIAMLAVGGLATSSFAPKTLSFAAHAQDVDTSTIEEMRMGAEDAPVTVIEYASYTCPHCASFHAGNFKRLKEDYIDTGKVNFIYREVYFDRYGLWASMVARCGGEMRFFGITDILYEEQRDWLASGDPAVIVDELRTIGKKAGLDDAALDVCLSDASKAETLVAWYQANAEADGVQSTPSFVINGERYSNMNYDEFSAILDEELGS